MKTLKIQLENGYIVEGVKSLSMNFFNSIFDVEVFRGQFSNGITIQKTAGNVVNFNYYHVSENSMDRSAKMNVYLKIGDYQLDAILAITSADETSYRGTILLGFSRLLDAMKTKKLFDIETETVELVDHPFRSVPINSIPSQFAAYAAYQNALALKLDDWNRTAYESGKTVCFPHFQRGGSSLTDPRHHNKFEIEIDDEEERNAPTFGFFGGISPAFFLTRLLYKAFDDLGFEMLGEWLEVPFVDRILTFGTKEAPIERSGVTYVPQGLGVWAKFPLEFDTSPLKSDIDLLSVLKKIKNHFFIPLWLDMNKKKLHLQTWDAVLDSTDILDWTDKFEGWSLHEDAKESGLDFTYEIENDAWADASISSIEEFEIKGSVPAYSNLAAIVNPQPKDLWFVEDLAMFYKAEFDSNNILVPAPSWKPFSQKAFGKKTGDRQIVRKFILPTLDDNSTLEVYLSTESNPVFQGNRVNLFEFYSNHAFMKPNLEYTGKENKEFRIAFWMGRIFEDIELNYRWYYAANSVGDAINWGDVYNRFELEKPDFSLWVEAGEGRPFKEDKDTVVDRFGLRYIDFKTRTKQDRGYFRLTEADIVELKCTQKIRVGNNLYFFDSIKTSIPIVSTCEVNLLWIPPGI